MEGVQQLWAAEGRMRSLMRTGALTWKESQYLLSDMTPAPGRRDTRAKEMPGLEGCWGKNRGTRSIPRARLRAQRSCLSRGEEIHLRGNRSPLRAPEKETWSSKSEVTTPTSPHRRD